MNLQRPSCAVVVALIATQVLGPAVLWAADQRGVQIEANRRVVAASLSGDQLTVQNSDGSKVLHFRDAVNVGDQITTGNHTVADVLIGNRAVVTLGPGTAAQFMTVSDEQTTIQVSQGLVRVVAAASALGKQGMVTVQTPTGQVQTRGGIVRVLVDAPIGVAEHAPAGEARPYRASYSPSITVAALTPSRATIQVEEGSAEILAGAGGKTMTLQAGQAVTIQSGQVGAISKFVNQAGGRVGVLATAGHSQTPKEGRDHLVALQVEQATALGNALTGAAETGEGKSGRKDDSKNVINGATGGVALANNSLVSSLFGGGNTANPGASNPINTTGAGYGIVQNDGDPFAPGTSNTSRVFVNGRNREDSGLLVFTRKDPIKERWIDPSHPSCLPDSCTKSDLLDALAPVPTKIALQPLPSVTSRFTVAKELVLIGGTPNPGHGGIAPTETLIVRGASSSSAETSFTNVAAELGHGLFVGVNAGEEIQGPTIKDTGPSNRPLTEPLRAANTTFVVKTASEITVGKLPGEGTSGVDIAVKGTLAQYSNRADSRVWSHGVNLGHVDGAITATSSKAIPIVNLAGGVTLDQGTKATIGTTTATNKYFLNPDHNIPSVPGVPNAKSFNGSLLSVIDGPTAGIRTAVTVQGQLLGVYDGSTIDTEGGNKALLSVLDAKLTGPASPIPLIDIAKGQHFPGFNESPDRNSTPNVNVTSAVVVRSTKELNPIQLDRALLEASAPLFALTHATMTTTSHFADLAGNKNQSLVVGKSLPGDAMVALSASTLTINGSLLNLNAATATVNGYLFSLTNGSTLTLNNGGALFSVTDHSSLNLNGNAFGVFGSGANTLSIDNNLCTATCFQLVNSANQPIVLPNGTPLHVAGATHNVVLPDTFKVFALAPGAPTPTINIGANDALFTVDGTSTLTIKGTAVVKP